MQFQKYPHPDYPQTSIYFKNQGDVQQHAKSLGDKKAEQASQEEVELNKDALLDRLNAYEDEKRALLAAIAGNETGSAIDNEADPVGPAEIQQAPAVKPKAAKESPAQTGAYLQSDIVEAINEADAGAFGRILEASICRLGELRAEGWDVFSSLSRDLNLQNMALERGLGSLVLAAAVLTGEDPQGQVIQKLRKRKPKEQATKRGFEAPKNDTGI